MDARRDSIALEWIIARRIRERRKMLGLTQEQVVTRMRVLGVDRSDATLSNMEKGAGLYPDKILAVATALKCTVMYLYGLTDDPTKWTPDQRWPVTVGKREFPGWLNRQANFDDLEQFGDA